ncbi:MAG: hypothetical protein JXB13_08870 [Phycisphaerae bacterium]|nr:hypothetical protein [Phycisphaerae bacterium]
MKPFPLLSRRPTVAALAVGLGLACLVVAIHRANARSLVGFHGVTHSAIAFSVLQGHIPPENPLAVGLDLPYYWAYHLLLAGVARLLTWPPVYAAELINVATVIGMSLLVVRVGRWLLGSLRGGLIALAFALFAVNPLGPIFLAYQVLSGTVGLAISEFARSPSHPMLRAMYLNDDVRWGSGFFFFLQPSSRSIAFLAAVSAAVLICRSLTRLPWLRGLGVALSTGIACSMNPVVGTGTAFGLGLGLLAVSRIWRPDRPRIAPRTLVALWVSLGAGVVLSFPTYSQLLNDHSVGLPIEGPLSAVLPKALYAVLFGLMPIGLTTLAWWQGRLERPQLRVLAIAGLSLAVLCTVTHVSAGREHSFFNLALYFLAFPAAAACLPGRSASPARIRQARGIARAAVAALVPVTAVTLFAFLYRQPIPLHADGMYLRDPRDPDRAATYAWLAENTPPDSLVLTDVHDGKQTAFYDSESEIPAMTGRSLFIDVHGWYMPADPRVEKRRQAVDALFAAATLASAQTQMLE